MPANSGIQVVSILKIVIYGHSYNYNISLSFSFAVIDSTKDAIISCRYIFEV